MKQRSVKNNLQKLRKEKGITQEQLAEALEISRQSVISIEKGDCSPSLCHALKIAKYFGKNIEDIFELKESP